MLVWTRQSEIWAGFSATDPLHSRTTRLYLYLKAMQIRVKHPKEQLSLHRLYSSVQSLFSASLYQGGLIQGACGDPVLLFNLPAVYTRLLDAHESPGGSLCYQKSAEVSEILAIVNMNGQSAQVFENKSCFELYDRHLQDAFWILFIFIVCRSAYYHLHITLACQNVICLLPKLKWTMGIWLFSQLKVQCQPCITQGVDPLIM